MAAHMKCDLQHATVEFIRYLCNVTYLKSRYEGYVLPCFAECHSGVTFLIPNFLILSKLILRKRSHIDIYIRYIS